jgi:HAE1 family hydrophobic/amphiphilic exporter-1
MNVSRRFIEYPVMTTLLMVALLIFGAVAYSGLPVSELPNVDFPTIQVNASLAGADPETVASTLAGPLENAFSTIPGIDSMTSSSVQGSVTITIQFALDRNIDAAGTDVQAAISSALSRLPKTMINPPTFRKVNPTDDPVLFLVMSSKTLPLTIVDEYADTLLARQLSQVSGVAQVNVFGAAQYAVRIQADPAALVARGIGIDKLAAGIQNSSVDQATGATNGPTDAQIIRTSGQLENAAAFRNQIIAYSHGAPVRLGDVAHVIDSVNDVRQGNWYRGQRAITIAIMRQPGSNTIEVVNNVKKVLPQFRASLPPAIQLSIRHDRSQTIRASVSDVQETLLIAAALVVGVIFLFLRKLSATVIPSVTLPIAVIGTFAGMSIAGFSLDNLSLMALTLSVGFVVDDAIVMLENIVRHVEEGEKPFDAAVKGSAEIGFTILSMTVSLTAVFIPLVFMGGIVGRLLHEFAVTMMLAILVSGLVSVTLTPMLCARILKDERREKHNAFYNWSERSFEALQRGYDRSLRWSMAHKPVILALFGLSLAASALLFEFMPEDFLPPDDVGMLSVSIQAANGTSYERMVDYGTKVAAIFNADPNVAGAMLRVGSNGAGSNGANISIMLKPLSERSLSAERVARELRRKVANITGINVFVQNPPAIRIGGRSSRSTYQYTLQGMDFGLLERISDQLTRKLQTMPGFVGVNSDFDRTTPSVSVKIDRDRAASLGVTPAQIETAMGYAFGGEQVTLIYGSTNQYQVILELEPRYQRNTASLKTLYVTASNGTLVPLSAVTTISQSMIPLSVNHSGGVPAVTVSFDLAAGYSLSDAVSGIQRASAAIHMPATVKGSFQGTAGAFQQSTQNMSLLLIMATIVVYIILGILYESFIHPLTILSGLPSAAVGALLTLWIAGLPLTLYAFVGMIMLIGIVKKNAIMMIDFALQRQREDPLANAEQAIFEAALIRFRPIMMTTMAAMMGTLPIAFGSGMGADSRRPLGICVAGGLLLSQLLTLYITPVIYTYLDRLGLYFRGHAAVHQPGLTPAE